VQHRLLRHRAEALHAMVAETKVPVISSGGVSSAKDLSVLAGVEGLSGAIIGKALFDGLIQGNLREAMAAADA
jgi:phosphoribosylformimino-5-aminoimidazole carboxamide ribonucleotide (ProFAR) isomerase